MSARSDYIAAQMKTCRDQWFEDHEARVITSHPDVTVIEWSALGTWCYGMRIVIHRRWLVILGDIGEATYEWSSNIDPVFLLHLDFDYFRSKCRASPGGRDWDVFDADVGATAIREAQKDALDSGDAKDYGVWVELLDTISSAGGRDEWRQAIDSMYSDGDIQDGEQASHYYGMAIVPNAAQIGQYVGLQMALAAIHEKAAVLA